MTLSTDELKTISTLIAKASRQDLDKVFKSIQSRETVLTRNATKSFRVGQRVQFDSSKKGQVVGTIEKINSKTIIVKSGSTKWKVTPSLLSPAVQSKSRKAA